MFARGLVLSLGMVTHGAGLYVDATALRPGLGQAPKGGGAGAGQKGVDCKPHTGGNGGDGVESSITGVTCFYGGAGGPPCRGNGGRRNGSTPTVLGIR